MNMNLARLRQRLSDLEASARRRHRQPSQEQDDAARQRWRRLITDPAGLELYNRALVETEKVQCLHQRYGRCATCLAASEPVQAAWHAVEERVEQLSTGGDPS